MTDIDAIVADLAESGFHVGPGAEGWVPPEQLRAISAAAEEAGVPLHVVLVVPPADGGVYPGNDLLVRVHDAGGPDGLYVGVNDLPYTDPGDQGPPTSPTVADGGQVRLAVQQWGDIAGTDDLTHDVEMVLDYANGPGGSYPLGEGLLRVVEGLGDGTFGELRQAASEGLDIRAERNETGSGTSTPPWSGDGDGDTGDLVVGLVFLALVAAAVVVGARRVARRSRERTSRAFALPESVLERVREAGDAELARRARADVLALGEQIDEADLKGSGSSAWAATLDHYDAASRLLPTDPGAAVDPLDAVGAVVLAARGEEALAAARRGKPFVPTVRCFLNPLHGRADRDRTLEHDGRRVLAPVCAACRRDLEAGRRPDILDVVVRGRPQHYFDTDREPWASTGFGALEPDLVTRLHRGVR